MSQRHIEIAGRKVRSSVLNLSHHVARHLSYAPHFVRHGCDKTSMCWSLARLLFPPSPDTVFPPSGNDSSYGDQEFLSVCTEGNRKLELVPFSGRPRRPAPLILLLLDLVTPPLLVLIFLCCYGRLTAHRYAYVCICVCRPRRPIVYIYVCIYMCRHMNICMYVCAQRFMS